MDNARVDRIANAVLYEGYLLYPYRRSIKNVKRWTFGGVYPGESPEVRSGSERTAVVARVLVEGDAAAVVEGEVRFLHLIERRPAGADTAAAEECWHESEERRITLRGRRLEELAQWSLSKSFEFPARTWRETAADGGEPGGCVRHQSGIEGRIDITAEPVSEGRYRLRVSIANETPCDAPDDQCGEGDSSVLASFASAHVVLGVQGGQFVSRIDPPEELREQCPADPGDGLWPVLVGEEGERDTMLCSPIILYDYPEIAPESPGDFFDATEIDELLTLRILTLSDEEKQAVAALDERGRALLNRTESQAREQLARLHGAARSLRILEEPDDGP